MDHQDHVALIRAGVEGAGSRWLELGAGDGEFTLALADLLGEMGEITPVDRDRHALERLETRVRDRFPRTTIRTLTADFTALLPDGPFDGVLAANSLHFVADPFPVIESVRDRLQPGGRLVLVEYDADHGNPWVPHPISFGRWEVIARQAGLDAPRRLHRVPSRFLGAIYAASAVRR